MCPTVTGVSDLPTQTKYPQASRGRRASHHPSDDREQAILATAERLLREKPLADFSVDDLAKGAGISRPTFYFYSGRRTRCCCRCWTTLNMLSERMMAATFTAEDQAIPEDRVIHTLLRIWLASIYQR